MIGRRGQNNESETILKKIKPFYGNKNRNHPLSEDVD